MSENKGKSTSGTTEAEKKAAVHLPRGLVMGEIGRKREIMIENQK
jgi:hypothetical protein